MSFFTFCAFKLHFYRLLLSFDLNISSLTNIFLLSLLILCKHFSLFLQVFKSILLFLLIVAKFVKPSSFFVKNR